jgi:sortase A
MPLSNKKTIVALLTLCAGVVFIYTLLHSAVYVASDETDTGIAPGTTSITRIAPARTDLSVPVRIRIPSIGVDAEVVDVGLGKSGNMAVPYTYTEVGWYRYGPLPGELGSAVLDGHVDNGLGGRAVFARLGELRPGDTIYIETARGENVEFRVEDTGSYNVAEVPLERLFTQADQARLNLVTCEGVWIQEEKMYDRRLVVYAVLAA